MFGKASFLRGVFGRSIRRSSTDAAKEKGNKYTLALSPFLGGNYYYLLHEIDWTPDKPVTPPIRIVVPRGFVTDLASIPKILWPILPKDGIYARPAIVHDFHYWVQDKEWPKELADKTFLIGMKELKVSKLKAATIYYAVSWFGSSAWRKNKRLKDSNEGRILREMPSSDDITWIEWKKRPNVFMDAK